MSQQPQPVPRILAAHLYAKIEDQLLTPELYHPVLDCFMRALPHTYRNVASWGFLSCA